LGVNINKENRWGGTPLYYAYKNGNENVVKYLIELGAIVNNKRTLYNSNGIPLFDACSNGNETIVKYLIKYLIEQGANINVKNKHGETALFMACESKK